MQDFFQFICWRYVIFLYLKLEFLNVNNILSLSYTLKFKTYLNHKSYLLIFSYLKKSFQQKKKTTPLKLILL